MKLELGRSRLTVSALGTGLLTSKYDVSSILAVDDVHGEKSPE